MMITRILSAFSLFSILMINSSVYGQNGATFSDFSNLLIYQNAKSGVAMGCSDMNGDGYDDIMRLIDADSLIIEYQQPDGSFIGIRPGMFGAPDNTDEWSFCAADLDGNGYLEIITGGNRNGQKVYRLNDIGTAYGITMLAFPTPGAQASEIYNQATNLIDIDNDGRTDYFACNDVGSNSVYRNDASDSLMYDLSLINTEPTPPGGGTGKERFAGNYGTTWSDYDWDGDVDLYISKCRLGVSDSSDQRRVNMLMRNDGAGVFTRVDSTAGLRPYAQSWASSFADFDNDGDMDFVLLNHGNIDPMIYFNNGDGTFLDITSKTTIVNDLFFLGDCIQVVTEDFNNDTYVDILMTNTSNQAELFFNNGDTTFYTKTGFPEVFDLSGYGPQTAVAGDFNHDGFTDLMMGFAFGFNQPSPINRVDKLQINDGNSNHFINITLKGTVSNPNGIGSRIETYGAFGKQIREVRAGESYGIQHSMARNFGLAEHTTLDSVIVRWTSGIIDIYENVAADQFLMLREGCAGDKVSHTVTNVNDAGAGSLRETINLACDFDTIVFDITLEMDTIKLTSGEILLDKSIIINGLGPTNTLISGNDTSRIFNVLPSSNVTLQDLAIIDAEGSGIGGGAIYNAGKLFLGNVVFDRNMKDAVPKAIQNVGEINVLDTNVSILNSE